MTDRRELRLAPAGQRRDVHVVARRQIHQMQPDVAARAAHLVERERQATAVGRPRQAGQITAERDVLRAFDQMHADPARVSTISKGMTLEPQTIDADATVGEAMDRMLDGGFRHLPVIDGEKLVGVISLRDLALSISKG